MSTLSSTLFSTSDPTTQKPNASILRPGGAAAAPGFAQVLQAFDQDEPSTLVDKGQERSESAASDEAEGTSDDTDQAAATAASNSDDEPGAQDKTEADTHTKATSGDNAQTSEHAGIATAQDGNAQLGKSVAQGTAQSEGQAKSVSIQSEAGLDPLQNKSDQAKLSIRG